MAKAKLQQIRLTSGDNATQPPFPGGWVLAVFDALNAFAPTLAAKHKLPISQRTQERINAAKEVKQSSYEEIETKVVELVTALFPKVSAVNGFATKYVYEYFRIWKCAAEIGPAWLKVLGFNPGESSVLGRALVRDLVLRLCYLESCERKLRKTFFSEEELALLRHDCPTQVYQNLICERARSFDISQEKLAGQLRMDDRTLRRVKRGDSLPSFALLLRLTDGQAGSRSLAGIGFIDQLLKTLGLHQSVLRYELLANASVFFRIHPRALESFSGDLLHETDSGPVRGQTVDFEGYIAFGEHLLLHPGFNELYREMPDALWRCHLYTLQFARIVELAQAYFQFATADNDAPLERVLYEAEHESDGCPYRWMDNLKRSKSDLPLPPAKDS